MGPERSPGLWRAACLAAVLLCVAAPLLLPSTQICRRTSLVNAAKTAARRQLYRLPEVQVTASAAALAQRARQAAAKVAAGLPVGGGGGVAAPYRQLWRQLDVDCGGGWQREYAQLHGDIIAGRQEERVVVSVATATGAQLLMRCIIAPGTCTLRACHEAGMLMTIQTFKTGCQSKTAAQEVFSPMRF